MPSKYLALKKGLDKELKISRKWSWNDFCVFYKDKLIGKLKDKKSLKNWWSFEIEGKKLEVQLARLFFVLPELNLIYDGEHLVESPWNPELQIKQLFLLILILWCLNVVLWLFAWLWNVEALMNMGISAFTALYWLVFVVLGFWVRQKSIIALGWISVLYLVDVILNAYFVVSSDGQVGSVLVKIVVFMFLLRGFSAIGKIRNRE